jgi:hypothetical protein
MNLENINHILQNLLATGNLELRLAGIDNAEPDTAGIAWAINDLLDLVETFMREADNRFALAAAGQAGEQIYSRGFRGSFRDAVEKLNRNLRNGDTKRTTTTRTTIATVNERAAGREACAACW